MIDTIFTALVYVLAIYGLFEIIKTVFYIMQFTNLNENGIYIIIGVKNQEKHVEEVLRSVLFKIMYGKEERIKKVILTDLDSIDNTMKKLKSIKSEDDCIKVMSWRKCKEMLDLIDEE